MLAIIQTQGHQHMVSKGDKITVDSLDKKEGEKVSFEEVLLLEEKGEVKVGKPLIKGAKAEGKVIRSFRGDKVKVFKMKPKKRYKRTIGFRPSLTEVEILSVKA